MKRSSKVKIAEKVVRIESDAYEYIVDFANEHDFKIGEARRRV